MRVFLPAPVTLAALAELDATTPPELAWVAENEMGEIHFFETIRQAVEHTFEADGGGIHIFEEGGEWEIEYWDCRGQVKRWLCTLQTESEAWWYACLTPCGAWGVTERAAWLEQHREACDE